MVKIEINDIPFFVESNISLLEACESLGISVPRFCYHHALSVAGNCRICLIEISNSPKAVASCALPVVNNMKIYVDSPLVRKARENVLEALLLNHPLDCPICDQAGECDLQDQSRVYGIDINRFFFKKRVVEDKNLGFFIKTIMTRCIHCTRCVRFNSEISGDEILGTLGRGSNMEIGSYKLIDYDADMSSNVIDLCPVGALTSNSYSFKSRSWDLKTFGSIELSDGFCNNIFISFKDFEILRVFPRSNYLTKDIFISDRSRYYFDYQNNRSNFIIIKNKELKKLKDNSSFNLLKKEIFSSTNILMLVDNSTDLNTLFFAKNLLNIKIKNISFFVKKLGIKELKLNFYINWLNNIVLDIDLPVKTCFLIASNLKVENVVINSKLYTKKIQNDFNVFGLSLNFKDNLNTKFISLSIKTLFNNFEAKSRISLLFIKNRYPLFFLGENLFKRNFFLDNVLIIIKKIINSSILIKSQISLNTDGTRLLNVHNLTKRQLFNCNYLFCLNLEDSYLLKKISFKFKQNIINIGSHKGNTFKKFINFFPCTTEYEEEKIFFNLEQKIQKTSKILSVNKNILTIKEIILFLLGINNKNFYYKYLLIFYEIIIKIELFHEICGNLFYNFFLFEKIMENKNCFLYTLYPIKNLIEDSFLLNNILKNSINMQKNSYFMRKKAINFY